MSDYISKQEAIQKVTEVELQDGTFADAKIKIGAIKTLNEKEIIRKAFERVVERLEECEQRYDDVAFAEMNENGHTLDFEYAKGKKNGVDEAIEIVKEECEINE